MGEVWERRSICVGDRSCRDRGSRRSALGLLARCSCPTSCTRGPLPLNGNPASRKHPYLAEVLREFATSGGYDYTEEFEFGLDFILDGLERFLDR